MEFLRSTGCRAHKHKKHDANNAGANKPADFLQKIQKMFPQFSGVMDQLKNLMPNSGATTSAPPATTTPRPSVIG